MSQYISIYNRYIEKNMVKHCAFKKENKNNQLNLNNNFEIIVSLDYRILYTLALAKKKLKTDNT